MSKVTSEAVNETAARRAQAAPEFAKQTRARVHRKADGDIHKVGRNAKGKSRVQEAAAVTEVKKAPIKRWMKASALPAIEAPPGYHVEYVRRDNATRGDHENLIAHCAEGWEFARREMFPGKFLPTQTLSDFGQCIGNASSILMMLPLELKQQRDTYYRTQRNNATRAVGMPDPAPEGVSHSAMPIVEDENKTRVAMRRGMARRAPVKVADDA